MITAGIIDGNYLRRELIRKIDSSVIERAKSKFEHYRDRMVILNNFEDLTWELDDQRKITKLDFTFDELKYKANCADWLAPTSEMALLFIKTYIALNLGKVIAPSLQRMLSALLLLIEYDFNKSFNMSNENIHCLKEFISLLPYENQKRDDFLFYLEEIEERNSRDLSKSIKDARMLSDFKSYFRFDEELKKFWLIASKDEKLKYYPIYLWWNITGILPLRVTEFLLTPRDCIKGGPGNYTLTIRRSKLKGKKKIVRYSIEHDYNLVSYRIPDGTAEEIKEYISLTQNMKMSKFGTLFVPGNKISNFDDKNYDRNYYTYDLLDYCLDKFYQNVLSKKYKLVDDDFDSLKDDEINLIRLGDTRHIAMISLLLSGSSLSICKELAGHSSINISANYYSNIDKLIECSIYETNRRLRDGNKRSHINIDAKKGYSNFETTIEVEGGRCASPKWVNNNIDDCKTNVNSNGEIGVCQFCKYFRDKNGKANNEIFNVDEAHKLLERDKEFLIKEIDLYRKFKGSEEEIDRALIRLQSSGNNYRNCLLKKIDEGNYA